MKDKHLLNSAIPGPFYMKQTSREFPVSEHVLELSAGPLCKCSHVLSMRKTAPLTELYRPLLKMKFQHYQSVEREHDRLFSTQTEKPSAAFVSQLLRFHDLHLTKL